MAKLDIDEVVSTLEFTDEDRFYVRVHPFDIRVVRDADGITISVFSGIDEGAADDPVATIAVLDSEVEHGN